VNRLGGITGKRVALGIAAFIIVGGFVLALLSNSSGLYGSLGPVTSVPAGYFNNSAANEAVNSFQGDLTSLGSSVSPGYTQVIGQVTTSTSTAIATTTTAGYPEGGLTPYGGENVTQGSPANGGGLIEFSSSIGIRSSSPQQTASAVVALAYLVGGYVAYQSTYTSSAYVVIRVPAAEYQQVLGKVEAMGTVLSLSSNSNDVSVQYTDLNATLASLQTEQGALLKLLNQSSTINSTLAIETQLQQVNTQINEVESQILQTKTLIEYSTIDVTINESAQSVALSMTLSATPTNGTSPLSVTFNAVVKGGAQPYVVNYNFGDGYSSQGQIVIHTYFQAGAYKVLVTATDQNGTVVQSSTTVKVVAAQSQSGIQTFFGSVANLFTSVVEGIVEVAVVVLPLAAVGAAIVLPIQRHGRNQKVIKQSQ
jgi:PKD repeat protein